jgi:thymidylate synthase
MVPSQSSLVSCISAAVIWVSVRILFHAGVPFNIASYSMLTRMIAHVVGYLFLI